VHRSPRADVGGILPSPINAFLPSLKLLSYPLEERSIPHGPWVPATNPRPPCRNPCGADGYFLPCGLLGRFLAVRGTFLGRWVVVDPARCLEVYEGRRAPQSFVLGSLPRSTLFRPRGRRRYRAPLSPSRRGRYNPAPEKRHLYRH
jgi:hypothetical protein